MDDTNNNQQDELSRRELKKQYMENKKTSAGKSKSWLWGLLIVILVGVGIYLFTLGNDEKEGMNLDDNAVTADDHVKGGSENSPVTLIEYGDFQCPACRASWPMVTQLNRDFPSEVRIVYRHFPLTQIHINAVPAALASEAAARQGKFWEMHDLLFERQPDWQGSTSPDDIFIRYAGELGLNIDQFRADLGDPDLLKKIQDHLKTAVRLGLPGTPSFFVNGESIESPGSYEDLKAAVQGKLDAE